MMFYCTVCILCYKSTLLAPFMLQPNGVAVPGNGNMSSSDESSSDNTHKKVKVRVLFTSDKPYSENTCQNANAQNLIEIF